MNATKSEIKGKVLRNLSDKVASIATYWAKPGLAINAIVEILATAGVEVVDIISFSDACIDYRSTYRLIDAWGCEVKSCLIFMWHRMEESGRYEITTYLS